MANKLVHYRVPKHESMYTMQGTNIQLTRVRVPIPLTDVIVDKDGVLGEKYKGKRVSIRFVAGAETLVLDEQIKQGIPRTGNRPEDYQPRPLDKIVLIDGNYYTDMESDPLRTQYMTICNYNGSNANRDTNRNVLFEYVDKEKIAQKDYDEEIIMFTAKKLIIEDLKTDSEKLRRLGKILLGSVDSMDDMDVRNALLNIAKKMPDASNPVGGSERILTAFKTLNQDSDDVINDAERLGVIQFTAAKAIWKDDGATITSYKIGSAGKSKLIEFLNKPENAETYQLLKDRVKEVRLKESEKFVAA